MPEAKTSKTSIQPEDTLSQKIPLFTEGPSKVACQIPPRIIGIRAHQIPLGNRDIFAWKPVDMPGVPRELIEHELHLEPKAKPVKQWLRHFTQDKKDVINREIARLLDAGFIKKVFHLDWLANPILVPKKNKDWRMCANCTDLNATCNKDPFKLPRIYQVVYSTSGCSLLGFLDCYYGYHQIPLK
jgi:hypothetical protein